tara:strand:- start:998 stop:1558 length:561 start_codon:yes stop_codon:yes gene_type:complete
MDGKNYAFQGGMTGATSGAIAGSAFGPPGTVIGGIIGGLAGMMSGQKRDKRRREMSVLLKKREMELEGLRDTGIIEEGIDAETALGQAQQDVQTQSSLDQLLNRAYTIGESEKVATAKSGLAYSGSMQQQLSRERDDNQRQIKSVIEGSELAGEAMKYRAEQAKIDSLNAIEDQLYQLQTEQMRNV